MDSKLISEAKILLLIRPAPKTDIPVTRVQGPGSGSRFKGSGFRV